MVNMPCFVASDYPACDVHQLTVVFELKRDTFRRILSMAMFITPAWITIHSTAAAPHKNERRTLRETQWQWGVSDKET